MYRITGHYSGIFIGGSLFPNVSGWPNRTASASVAGALLVDGEVGSGRGDDDVALNGDSPYRRGEVQRRHERGGVGQPPHPHRAVMAVGADASFPACRRATRLALCPDRTSCPGPRARFPQPVQQDGHARLD